MENHTYIYIYIYTYFGVRYLETNSLALKSHGKAPETAWHSAQLSSAELRSQAPYKIKDVRAFKNQKAHHLGL